MNELTPYCWFSRVAAIGVAVVIPHLPSLAEQVELQNPTATLSQDGGWNAELITDGITDEAGWAIYDFGSSSTAAQTAVVETASDIGFASGSLLTFKLYHLNENPACSLGHFKLLYTTDDRSMFADGQNSGGDVTATWVTITPHSATATEGAELEIQSDGSILASSTTNPDTTIYTISAEVFVQGITGFRIEALTDSSLPTSGPGRSSNGNFVLTEFEVNILPLVLAPERQITWDPGVRGGIPNRTTIYTTLSSSATAAQIQTALNNCPNGQVVKLNSGTYNINAMLTIPSGKTLRGSGMTGTGATILKGQSGFTDNHILQFNNSFDGQWGGTARNLVSPTKGATTITTTAAHGWSIDDILLIDMEEQPTGDPPIDNSGFAAREYSQDCEWCGRASGTRPIGQWVKVVSVTSTTATIDPPLYWSYANSPEAIKLTGLTHYAGVEDLAVDNLDSVYEHVHDDYSHLHGAEQTVGVWGGINCWLSNVELKGNLHRAIWGFGGLWFTMQGCRVTGSVPIGTDDSPQYGQNRGYGVFLGPHFTAGLFTDNIFEKLTMAIAYEGAASGNVFSYNFITDMWFNDGSDSHRRHGPLMHGPHPFMNLIEGNWSGGRIRADEYWGTSSHFTVLRNRVVQVDRGADDYQRWTIDIERRNWYWSFIGNLLGGAGSVSGTGVNENNYEYIGEDFGAFSDSNDTIWTIGYGNLGNINPSEPEFHDAGTLDSMIRWGNWCYRTNDIVSGSGITYHANNVVSALNADARRIPNSYYLNSKPAFFNGLDWPPYDPASPADNSHTRIPAGYRYVYGVNP